MSCVIRRCRHRPRARNVVQRAATRKLLNYRLVSTRLSFISPRPSTLPPIVSHGQVGPTKRSPTYAQADAVNNNMFNGNRKGRFAASRHAGALVASRSTDRRLVVSSMRSFANSRFLFCRRHFASSFTRKRISRHTHTPPPPPPPGARAGQTQTGTPGVALISAVSGANYTVVRPTIRPLAPRFAQNS
jgi:hypothetical protein